MAERKEGDLFNDAVIC